MNDCVPGAGTPAEDAATEQVPAGQAKAEAGQAVTGAAQVPGGAARTAPAAEQDPAAPAPLHVPRTPTGHADVDALLERLADADHLATDGHLEVYEDVHRGLRDALTALDARPGPPAPPSPYRQGS